MPRPRTALLGSLVLALAVGFFVGGYYAYRTAIGLDPSAFPAGRFVQGIGEALFPGLGVTVGGLVLALGSVLFVATLAFVWTFASLRARRPAPDLERRSLLAAGLGGAGAAAGSLVVGLLGLGARFAGVGNQGRGWPTVLREIYGAEVVETDPDPKETWKGSRVRGYRRLGRTGWQVSDIVMGTNALNRDAGHEIVKLAVERGLNYVDTSPDYSAAGSETAVGRALRDLDRSRVFLATKFCTPTGHLPAGTRVATYRRAVLDSLGRLGTDYVDLVHVHACDEVDRLLDPHVHEAFRQLRAEGKARFLGFSTHTPNLEQVAGAAIESGRFDVMMLAYHHGIWSRLGELIARARRERDMGVVAMKTLKGAKHHGLVGFRDHADAYSQGALKWVLSNPDVSCAVITMSTPRQVDEYLWASGRAPTEQDRATLREYDRQIVGTYCAPHCGVCLDSCPEGVPIHDVLRHRMYFEDYGAEREAMRLYSALERDASACAGCAAPCLGSCPVGIPIPERTSRAHELLKLA